MWMGAYVEDILLRQHIADMQRRAEINHLLRGSQAVRAPRGVRALVSRLLRRRAGCVPREAVDFHRHAGAPNR